MAQVVTITQYQAKDGSLFTSAVEADNHDFMQENAEKIEVAVESFANALGLIDRARSGKVNTAKDFLAWYMQWVDAGSVPVERTVFDTPKEDAVAVKEAEAVAENVVAEAVADETTGEAIF